MLGSELIAAYWTIAGSVRPGDASEASTWPVHARIEAVAEAGFSGLGLLHADLEAIERSASLAEIRVEIERAGLRHVELEVLEGWFPQSTMAAQGEERRRGLLRAAEILGARHIKAIGDVGEKVLPPEVLAVSFADLCHQASRAGTTIVLEPMPHTNIPDLDYALAVVRAAGYPNGKLLPDIWHQVRGGTSLSWLASIPGEAIGHVEVDDAKVHPEGSLYEDTIDRRCFCGEGELDVQGFLDAVSSTGYVGTIGVEVLSAHARSLSLHEAATRAYRSTALYLTPRASAS